MPAILLMLGGLLVDLTASIAGQALVALGIGFVTYLAVDASIGFAKDAVLAGISGLPAQAVAMAGTLKVGVCISMLLSALTARATLKGVQGGALKRMVQK